MLVVLDNAASAGQVRPLVPGDPRSAVIVTSRDRLAGLVAHDGARRLTLAPFTPQEGLALLSRVLGPRAVAAEPDAAAELTALCGHLPLALAVTAANITNHPHRGIGTHAAALRGANRLGAFDLNDGGQRTVRAAFDHTYAVLRPDAAALFRMIGLVPGADVTVPDAAALAETTAEDAERTNIMYFNAALLAST